MNFIIPTLGVITGLFVSLFTLLPIGIIFIFGIPMTRELTQQKYLKPDNPIVKRYINSVVLLTIIYFGISYAIYTFFPEAARGFTIAAIAVLVISAGKMGKNANNIQDYIETNYNHFTDEGKKMLDQAAEAKTAP